MRSGLGSLPIERVSILEDSVQGGLEVDWRNPCHLARLSAGAPSYA